MEIPAVNAATAAAAGQILFLRRITFSHRKSRSYHMLSGFPHLRISERLPLPSVFLYFFIKFFLHLHYPLCILGSIQYMCSNCFLPLESLDFTVFTSNSRICAISRILNPSP